MWEFILGVLVVSLAIYGMISVLMSRMILKRKLFWFVVVALVPVFGPIVYYTVRPQDR